MNTDDPTKIFTEATISSPGDPSVGIWEAQINISPLFLDLNCFVDEDQANAVRDALESILAMGMTLIGEERLIAYLTNEHGSWVASTVRVDGKWSAKDIRPMWLDNISPFDACD